MDTHRSGHLKRTDLFLVRVWTEGDKGQAGDGDSRGKVQWHGKVQRVVDGESRRFDNLQGLVDLLLEMLPEAGDG